MVKYEIIKERDPTVEDRLAAAANLSGAGFKLYCYLESFPWGATSYSRKDFVDKINISLKCPLMMVLFGEIAFFRIFWYNVFG